MEHSELFVSVACIRYLATDTNEYELKANSGQELPPYSAGSHIDLLLPNGIVRQYSLIAPYSKGAPYRIAVKRAPNSRGGSIFLHDSIRVGQKITISQPRNAFSLHPNASHSILIAGGIGITPIWCMAQDLANTNQTWNLYYAVRTRSDAAFLGDLEKYKTSTTLHIDAEAGGARLDINAITQGAPADTHFYCCGPLPMLEAFKAATAHCRPGKVHEERFESPVLTDNKESGFHVKLARSGREVAVMKDQSLLQALLNAGVNVDHSCQMGVCGACEVRVLEGTPDHRDQILTERERASNNTMMVCCSRSLTDSLVLDI